MRPRLPLPDPRGLEQLGWLLSGVPPGRIGWGPGPLTAARRAGYRLRHAVRGRPLRLCLLEHPHPGTAFAAATAYWINRRSRLWSAVRNGRVEDADLVWVLTQDPLDAAAHLWLAARLARVRPGVAILNPPATYDAYHRPGVFDRLAAAGVRVPCSTFDAGDVGRTVVVHKAVGEQGSRKARELYRGPRPGFRTFEAVDGRGADGLHRRYRAFVVGDLVVPEDVIVSRSWNACLRTLAGVERCFALTEHERDQLLLLTRTVGLDVVGVDFLRRRSDGAPVFLDINVYPTTVGAWQGGMPAGDRGQWHVFDNAERLGLPPPGGVPVWEQVDAALARLAARARTHRPGPRPLRGRASPRRAGNPPPST